jgi:hypothetical protein
MTQNRSLIEIALCCAVLLGQPPSATLSLAADPKEKSKDIIAVQIRKQGFACKTPLSAERDTTTGNPDDPVWTLKCDNASYRVHLVPNMAAKIERLAGRQNTTTP